MLHSGNTMIEMFQNTDVIYASPLKNVVESKDTHSLKPGVIELKLDIKCHGLTLKFSRVIAPCHPTTFVFILSEWTDETLIVINKNILHLVRNALHYALLNGKCYTLDTQ